MSPSRLLLSASLALLLTTMACLARASTPASYDTPDHDRFQAFLNRKGATESFSAFEAHLRREKVHGIVPAWTLWRQGTDWRALGTDAFAVPPKSQWASIVPTLKVLRMHIIPATGKVEVVSGFRTNAYNQRAGGAAGSRHKWFEAVDVVPERAWDRERLHKALLAVWRSQGPSHKVGLGLYGRTRFHVDTHRHRRW